jgi:N-acetylmuramic acid 6-phosphate etherase
MMRARGVTRKDVVVGLAACRRTPFVVAALDEAAKIGAGTIYVTCNPVAVGEMPGCPAGRGRSGGGRSPDLVIAVDVGPEVLMGSTRMKSGTAEKMVLNMISTASMIRLGKVYGNLMVDLWATSEKLRQRSVRIVMLATGCGHSEAVGLLKKARGSAKGAIDLWRRRGRGRTAGRTHAAGRGRRAATRR